MKAAVEMTPVTTRFLMVCPLVGSPAMAHASIAPRGGNATGTKPWGVLLGATPGRCQDSLHIAAPTRRWLDSPMTLLQRRDAARRMARFYRIWFGDDLFGNATVIREWGRIGSPGRVRVDVHDNPAAAAAWLARIEQAKRRKGYAAP